MKQDINLIAVLPKAPLMRLNARFCAQILGGWVAFLIILLILSQIHGLFLNSKLKKLENRVTDLQNTMIALQARVPNNQQVMNQIATLKEQIALYQQWLQEVKPEMFKTPQMFYQKFISLQEADTPTIQLQNIGWAREPEAMTLQGQTLSGNDLNDYIMRLEETPAFASVHFHVTSLTVNTATLPLHNFTIVSKPKVFP